MIGFVSALSSSLAVIILIMSIMMVNMFTSMQSKSDPSNTDALVPLMNTKKSTEEGNDEGKAAKQANSTMSVVTDDGDGTITLNPNVVSPDVANAIKSKSNLTLVKSYCEYGYNYSYTVAMRYATFNIIVLAKTFADTGIKIKSSPPVLNEDGVNKCYVSYE